MGIRQDFQNTEQDLCQITGLDGIFYVFQVLHYTSWPCTANFFISANYCSEKRTVLGEQSDTHRAIWVVIALNQQCGGEDTDVSLAAETEAGCQWHLLGQASS